MASQSIIVISKITRRRGSGGRGGRGGHAPSRKG